MINPFRIERDLVLHRGFKECPANIDSVTILFSLAAIAALVTIVRDLRSLYKDLS